MKIKSINKIIMYINDQNALVNTFIRKPINYKLLISLVTLNTLKVLNILTDLKADKEDFEVFFPVFIVSVPPKKNNSTKLNTTIVASNIFIISAK